MNFVQPFWSSRCDRRALRWLGRWRRGGRSPLPLFAVRSALGPLLVQPLVGRRQPPRELGALEPGVLVVRVDLRGGGDLLLGQRPAREAVPEIGRASCRERGEGSAGGARAERRA